MRARQLFASTWFRLGATYAALILAAFGLAGAGVWFATASAARNDLRDRIAVETEAIREEIEHEGLAAAAAAIRMRAERPGALEYRLTDPSGRVIAGNLPLPPGPPGWQEVDLPPQSPSAEGRDDLLLHRARMGDGSLLVVGDDLARAERVRDTVLWTLAWIAGGTALVSLALGLLATRNALARIDAVIDTLAEVAAGHLDARSPERRGPRRDDLDRLARGVNAMLDRIQELMTGLRRVSSNVAHDLRTPLSHVRQRLEYLARVASASEREAAIDAVQVKIDEMMRIFDAMLRLSEIEAGGARARFGPVRLDHVVERVADAFRPDMEASGRQLHIGRLDCAPMTGDADLIAQAVANLTSNALRHTPAGTCVTLDVECAESEAVLTVRDDGPGVAPELRAQLMEPFARSDSSRSTPGGGLGLSIVAAIARMHTAEVRWPPAPRGFVLAIAFPLTGR